MCSELYCNLSNSGYIPKWFICKGERIMINQKQFRVALFQTQPYIQLARVYRPIFQKPSIIPIFTIIEFTSTWAQVQVFLAYMAIKFLKFEVFGLLYGFDRDTVRMIQIELNILATRSKLFPRGKHGGWIRAWFWWKCAICSSFDQEPPQLAKAVYFDNITTDWRMKTWSCTWVECKGTTLCWGCQFAALMQQTFNSFVQLPSASADKQKGVCTFLRALKLKFILRSSRSRGRTSTCRN